ncbi:MAG TPA: glycosyltransferase, partial [Nitrososphaerales archaeon]|nr:glycosyltransferase [Nitrososphaerales archaeon]
AVTRRLRASKTLLLHSHDFNTLVGSALCKRMYGRRVGLIYDSHELTPGVYSEWYGESVARVVARVERTLARLADGIVAANSAIAAYLGAITAAPAATVYNCPETSEVPLLSPEEAKARLNLSGKFVVLFVGRVRQDYDVDMLVRTARTLRESGNGRAFRFVFVGPGQTFRPLEGSVEADGLGGMFEFKEWVPYDELLLLYRASDLCFAVTRDLGANTRILTPIKVFESMACGLPVAVRTGTLAAQIVTESSSGIAVEDTESAFARRLVELSEHPGYLRQLGEGGVRAFHDSYNWEEMERRLLDLYGAVAPVPSSGGSGR